MWTMWKVWPMRFKQKERVMCLQKILDAIEFPMKKQKAICARSRVSNKKKFKLELCELLWLWTKQGQVDAWSICASEE